MQQNNSSKHSSGDMRIGMALAADRVTRQAFSSGCRLFPRPSFAFAGYIIIKGFAGAKLYMFAFAKGGINQFFNTVYLVFLAL